MGKVATSVSGTVYAPNGTLALAGVNVYVPANGLDPGPLTGGVVCDRCGAGFQGGVAIDPAGNPIAKTTNDKGEFELDDLPAVNGLTLVIQSGKWRNRVTLPTITACQPLQLPAAKTTFARNHTLGDMPQIAVGTGGGDPLECLLRKLGVDDSEFTTDKGTGKVHLYDGFGGANHLSSATSDPGQTLSPASGLWATSGSLGRYDLVLLGCEGQETMNMNVQSLLDYVNLGGRAYLSHFHYAWLIDAPWPTVATITPGSSSLGNLNATVGTGFDGGTQWSSWLVDVGASTTPGQVPIRNGYGNIVSLSAPGRVWLDDATGGNVEMFDFTPPATAAAPDPCGRVVYTDFHLFPDTPASGDLTGFPTECGSGPLAAQDLAIAYQIFQLGSCVAP